MSLAVARCHRGVRGLRAAGGMWFWMFVLFSFFFTAVLFFINIHAVRKRTDGLETSLQFCSFDAYTRVQLCIGVV